MQEDEKTNSAGILSCANLLSLLCWWQVLFVVTGTMEVLSLLRETSSPFWSFSWSLFSPVFNYFAAKFSVEFGNIPGAFSCLIITAALYALALTCLVALFKICFRRLSRH
jgi:hypothetical protein